MPPLATGGGGSRGAVVTGFGLGLIEGLTKVFYPEASSTVIFIIMAIGLLRPACSARGNEARASPERREATMSRVPTALASGGAGKAGITAERRTHPVGFAVMAVLLLPPTVVYPASYDEGDVMCFALFACAFNLLIGLGGLLSFGHAMPCSAGWRAWLAMRRQGIHFAMVTWAAWAPSSARWSARPSSSRCRTTGRSSAPG